MERRALKPLKMGVQERAPRFALEFFSKISVFEIIRVTRYLALVYGNSSVVLKFKLNRKMFILLFAVSVMLRTYCIQF